MSRITIEPAKLRILIDSIKEVWQAIAPDACEAFPRMKNIHAVETCIDAGRLEMFDDQHGVEAHATFRQMLETTSYPQALRYLARKISLI
jgi:hypothetical protein